VKKKKKSINYWSNSRAAVARAKDIELIMKTGSIIKHPRFLG